MCLHFFIVVWAQWFNCVGCNCCPKPRASHDDGKNSKDQQHSSTLAPRHSLVMPHHCFTGARTRARTGCKLGRYRIGNPSGPVGVESKFSKWRIRTKKTYLACFMYKTYIIGCVQCKLAYPLLIPPSIAPFHTCETA